MHVRLLITVLTLLLMLSCDRDERQSRRVITVTLPTQQWILEQIAGDTWDVQTLLQPGANPETFEPTMKQLMALEESKAYVIIGMPGYEQAIIERVRENFPALQVISCTTGIQATGHSHASEARTSHSHDLLHGDPHVWTSLRNARIMAANMLETLTKLDPGGEKMYNARFRSLDARLKALDDSVTQVLSAHRGSAFVVWHPSLSYFARDYGLTQIAMEHEGKEASAARMRASLDKARAEKPSVFFLQREYDSRQAITLAQEAGIPLSSISLTQPDIMAQIREITHAINAQQH